MKTPTTGSRAAGRRLAVAFALLAFVVLSTACEKKAALRVSRPARMSNYFVAGDMSESDNRDRLATTLATLAPASPAQSATQTDRKIVRNGSLELLVNDVGQSVTKISSVVSQAGGYVEKSTQTNSGGHSANMTVRVPAPRLDQVMAEVKGVATTVDRESAEAHDVTREYVDLDARLRNAQAEEAQYLLILKRATTIKDTLDVTEKISDVRGRIEQMQGEMKFLTAQIDMASLEISLRAESDAAVAGIHWRPLRQAKIAAQEMVSGLTDWADSVIAFFINLPLIAVWLFSIILLLLVVVRLLRWLWRKLRPKNGWRIPWRRSVSQNDADAS
jgi:Domain of unknown function (DUF4349)